MNIKKFEQYIFENKKENQFYLLFDELVFIKDIDYRNDVRVTYIKSDGTKHSYVGDNIKEFYEDFKETTDSFPMNFKKKRTKKEPLPKKTPKPTKKYNVVYYSGKKKMETVAWNKDIVLANGIIKKLENEDPVRYKSGTLKKDPV